MIKKPPKEKEAVDPAVKLLKDANVKLQASLRNLKKKTDVVRQDLNKQTETVPLIMKRGYPQSMVDFMLGKIDVVSDAVNQAVVLYGDMIMKAEETDPSKIQVVQDRKKEIDDAHTSIVDIKLKYDKTHGADVKKLTAGV